MRTPAAWLRSVKRRRPEVYWYTTRVHMGWRRESGYVGESFNGKRRDAQHLVGGGRYRNIAKPWADLAPRKHVLVSLPWWLGWKWLLRSLETVAIVLLRPRYNWSKNPWKRHRVGPVGQKLQRQQRDASGATYAPGITLASLMRPAMRLAGALLIVVGLIGWASTYR